MEPLTAMPPLPSGRAAIDAWRTLDRQIRKRLLAGDPAPDPTTAVIAVGYARTLLARSTLRHRLTAMAAAMVALLVIGVPILYVWPGAWIPWLICVLACAIVPRLLIRRRLVQLIRLENVNASRLWATEVHPAQPRPGAPLIPGQPVEFRYSTAALVRVYSILVLALVGTPLLILLTSGPTPISLSYAALAGALLLWFGYSMLRWVRPWLPALVLDAGGIWLPAQGSRTPWSQVTELRITPLRGGPIGSAGHRIASFMVADPEAALSGRRGPHLRRGRISIRVYGTPLSVADRLLAATAEDVVTAATAFTPAPTRRFGP